jgi:hypothetical protein
MSDTYTTNFNITKPEAGKVSWDADYAALADFADRLGVNHAGPTEPAVTAPNMLWADTSSGFLKQRNASDDDWITLWKLGYAPGIASQFDPILPIRPTLDLLFEPGVAPSLLSFTRASSATYINGAGLIKTASTNELRHDWDPSNPGIYKGILLEEARTNLIVQSENISSGWGFDNADHQNNPSGVIGPYGTEVSEYLQASVSAFTINACYHGITWNSGTTYSISVFAKYKPGEYQYISIGNKNDEGAGFAFRVIFDILNGTVGNSTTSIGALVGIKIEEFPNGWRRYTVIHTAGAAQSGNVYFCARADDTTNSGYNTTDNNGVYLFGMQVEAGAFPTSYIPSNTGSTTTRSADVATVALSAFDFNAVEGTLFSEASTFVSLAPDATVVTIDDTTTANRVDLRINQSASLYSSVASASSTSAAFTAGSTVVDQIFKQAIRCKSNDFNFCYDSNLSTPDLAGDVPVGLTMLRLGSYSGGGQLNGHVKRIAYFPVALSDANLQSITRP